MGIRKDYIERLIEQFAAVLAALVKARREKRHGEVRRLIHEGAQSVLGMEYGALMLADAGMAAQLLGQPERVRVLAQLVSEEAELLREEGSEIGAGARFRLALELWLESLALGGKVDEEAQKALRRLGGEVDPALLSERYQRLLPRG